MKLDRQSLLLYAVTDRTWLGRRYLADQVEEAILGGATFIQLRDKTMDTARFLEEASSIKQVTDRYRVPFVVNDRVDVAIACNADGVHVGQKDLSAEKTRLLIGPEKILGVSVQTIEQALEAEKGGADYIGVGTIFATRTKQDADVVSIELLREICASVSIPVVAIGGITSLNIDQLNGSGIAGVAIVSDIFSKKDITVACRKLRTHLNGEDLK